jgi:serine/threonine protein kinase
MFGRSPTSAEGTSLKARQTRESRGTSGYRALELINERMGMFTNKADIWGMGCILYELMFRMKAFSTDFAALEYLHTQQPPAVPPGTFEIHATRQDEYQHLAVIVHSLLSLDPKNRPSATLLGHVFTALCVWMDAVFSIGYIAVRYWVRYR